MDRQPGCDSWRADLAAYQLSKERQNHKLHAALWCWSTEIGVQTTYNHEASRFFTRHILRDLRYRNCLFGQSEEAAGSGISEGAVESLREDASRVGEVVRYTARPKVGRRHKRKR